MAAQRPRLLQRLSRRLALAAALCCAASLTQAQGRVIQVPTRPAVATSVFWQPVADAKATVLLFPGGAGGFGAVQEGRPTSNNFLVRSASHFTEQGLNVAIFGRPDDTQDLDYADRIGSQHLSDVRLVLAYVKGQSAAPVWLVGTSRGTVSATAAAIQLQADIAGLVLTSSVVSHKKPGALPRQDLAAIRVPVLVLHHSLDACPLCRPDEVPAAFQAFRNAPVKKLILASGGANPTGDVCAARHWHGFIGMERQAVDMMAAWILNPAN